jgi:hypothetical protein
LTESNKLGVFANSDEKGDDLRRNVQKFIHLLADSKLRGQRQQVSIALQLRDTVQPFLGMSGTITEEDFRRQCRDKASHILEDGASSKLLTILGTALQQTASQHRGFHRFAPFGWPFGALVWTGKAMNRWSNKLQLFKGAVKVLNWAAQTTRGLKEQQQHDTSMDGSDELVKEKLLDAIPLFLWLAWKYNELDIMATVDGACWKLFRDSSVSRRERFARARAVKILGEEFWKAAQEKGGAERDSVDDADLAIRIEIALHMAQTKVSCSTFQDASRQLIWLLTSFAESTLFAVSGRRFIKGYSKLLEELCPVVKPNARIPTMLFFLLQIWRFTYIYFQTPSCSLQL